MEAFYKKLLDNNKEWVAKSLEKDPEFGDFWKVLKAEYDLTKSLLLELTGSKELMEHYPVERRSIALREKIVLPLVLIQHYALQQINEGEVTEEQSKVLSKLVIRTVYGIVNAGRNLA